MGTKHFRRNVVFDPDGRFFKLLNIPSKFLASRKIYSRTSIYSARNTVICSKELKHLCQECNQGSIWKDPLNTIHAVTPIWSKGLLREIQPTLVLGWPERIEKNYLVGEDKFKYYNTEYENDEEEDGHGTHVVGSLQDTRLMRAVKTVWQPQPKLHFSILLIRMKMEKLSWRRRQIWIRRIIKLRTMPERESIQIVGDTSL